jgi:hypothetical protein
MSLILEKDIEKYLIKRIKQLSGLCYKWQSTITGVCDRIVLLNNQVWFVELKTPTGVVSKRQEIVFDELGEAGFPVHILRSKKDVDDFINQAMQSL